jgi:DNA-binding NarL/FixJ family response regulator
MKRITVLLADDTLIVRREIKKLLEVENDFEVVGEAENGAQAVALVKQLRPALVLMDVSMPLGNGFDATREIIAALPKTQVVMLSAHAEKAYVTEAVKSGAKGYLLKQNSAVEVCTAIREVLKGNFFFSAGVSNQHRVPISRA